CSKISIGSRLLRSSTISNASYRTRCAVLFLPPRIMRLMNIATRTLLYLTSGATSRLGGLDRLGMIYCLSEAELYLGFLAPYLLRACWRLLTPSESRVPRTMR